jgi:hypothetical protein
MGRRVEEEAEWDEDGWEGDDSGLGDANDNDEDEPTVPCPYCRREIFEDSPRCPHCGQYISDEDARGARKPWWIVLGALLCLAVVWVWVASR